MTPSKQDKTTASAPATPTPRPAPPNRIVISLDYKHENFDTGHTRFRRHQAIVTPDDIATCNVAITGPDLYDHNDTIAEVIWYGLCQSSSLVEDLTRKAATERTWM